MTAKQAHEEWFGNHRGLVNGLGDVPIILSITTRTRSRSHARRERNTPGADRLVCGAGNRRRRQGSYPKTSESLPKTSAISVTIGFGPGPDGIQKSAQAIMKKWDDIVLRLYARPNN